MEVRSFMVGPQMWEPARPAGFIQGFSRKYPGSRRGQRTSASLGAVRMRGAEEKTAGRRSHYLSGGSTSACSSAPLTALEAKLLSRGIYSGFYDIFFSLFIVFFSFVNVPCPAC